MSNTNNGAVGEPGPVGSAGFSPGDVVRLKNDAVISYVVGAIKVDDGVEFALCYISDGLGGVQTMYIATAALEHVPPAPEYCEHCGEVFYRPAKTEPVQMPPGSFVVDEKNLEHPTASDSVNLFAALGELTDTVQSQQATIEALYAENLRLQEIKAAAREVIYSRIAEGTLGRLCDALAAEGR